VVTAAESVVLAAAESGVLADGSVVVAAGSELAGGSVLAATESGVVAVGSELATESVLVAGSVLVADEMVPVALEMADGGLSAAALAASIELAPTPRMLAATATRSLKRTLSILAFYHLSPSLVETFRQELTKLTKPDLTLRGLLTPSSRSSGVASASYALELRDIDPQAIVGRDCRGVVVNYAVVLTVRGAPWSSVRLANLGL
jgi:hypothetical protein